MNNNYAFVPSPSHVLLDQKAVEYKGVEGREIEKAPLSAKFQVKGREVQWK